MWELAIIPVLSVFVFWTWQFINWVWLKPRKMERLLRKQGLKGNSYKFLFGDSKETARMYQKAFSKPIGIKDDVVSRLMPNIYHTVQKYGNFCFTWAGPRPRIFITDPDIAREVLSNGQVFLKTFKIANDTLKLLITGLPNLEGAEWSKSRSRVNPVFKLESLKPMVPTMQLCCEETLNELRELVSKGGGSCVVDVCPHMEIVTSSILAQLMFNCPYSDEIKETFLQLDELADLSSIHARIWSIPGEKYFPTKVNRRANAIEKSVRATFTSMINERLQKRETGAPENGFRDLLDVFMEELYGGILANKERQRIIDEVIGELKIFFFAGFETTSNLLNWSLIMLSVHHDCQARAREEVFQVLGSKEEITSKDLAKLKYITMVVNEALRLYPPGMELSRLVGKDTTIKGYNIPKDTLLTFPILMCHRSTEIWGDDAGEFRPDRFSDGVMKASKGEAAFLPFGWGPRICIGMNFSLLESKIMLAMLLREFSFELSPTYAHAPYVTFNVKPQYGAPLVLRKL